MIVFMWIRWRPTTKVGLYTYIGSKFKVAVLSESPELRGDSEDSKYDRSTMS